MTRKPPKGKSLAEVNPELAKEWHPVKNADLTPYDVLCGSGKKVWWKCDKGIDHIWSTSIDSRSRGTKCPVCSGQKVVLSNCLATLNPELVKEWHPTKNGNLTPFDVSAGSGKKIWWKCDKGDDHEWEAPINSRSKVNNSNGCPVCSGRKAVLSNCLATLNPELSKEWHPTKNGNLTPLQIRPNSGRKIWWKCDKGDDHEWKSAPDTRIRQSQNCPICSGQKVVLSNCLATLSPELAKEWHPTKNGNLTPFDVTKGTNKKVWWKCDKGDDHEYFSSISHRSNGTGCPICRGLKVVISNSLMTTHPDLIKEWHPTKNGNLTPFDVTKGTNKKVWWKCDKGDDHEWKSAPSTRIYQSQSCPVCSGKKVVKSNCLATTHPKLAKEWHPTKNRDLTPYDVVAGTGTKVWWKCDKGDDHEWLVSANSRTNFETKCPFCTLTPQSKQELTITFELIQFFEINPKGFKSRVNGKILSIDIFIGQLNLAIEFDGSYWHKDNREFDKMKSEELINTGFDLLRIREEPLKPINKYDIVSKRPFNPKEVTDNILKFILKRYDLPDNQLNDIKGYFRKRKVQNEEELDNYIDQILQEKAKRR